MYVLKVTELRLRAGEQDEIHLHISIPHLEQKHLVPVHSF